VSVVDVPTVSNGLNDETILLSIPGEDRSVVASAELVVGIAGQLLQSMGGPVFRLVELFYQSLLCFAVESL